MNTLKLFLMLSLIFIFTGYEKGYSADFTDNVAVHESPFAKGLFVISAEDIPQTDLAEVIVAHRKNPEKKFRLITSKVTKPKKYEEVDVVVLCYYINSDMGPRLWKIIFALKK